MKVKFRKRRSTLSAKKRRWERHPVIVLFFAVILISIYSGNYASASRDSMTANSIIPTSYGDDGDTSQWPLDYNYATNTAATTIYQNRHIYLMLYSCSWQKSASSGNYYLDYFLRKEDGTVIWLPTQDRGAFLADYSCVANIGGVELHKSFWMQPMEIPGAKPGSPSIQFTNASNYQVDITVSAKANVAAGTWYYDYMAHNKRSGKYSYDAQGGTATNATDYLTGFLYRIDHTPSNVALSGFQRWETSDASGATRSLSMQVPSQYVNSSEDWYIHMVSESYTGQYSDMVTVKIPKRGVHQVSYDLNGGSGDFPEQTAIYGKQSKVNENTPNLEGYTFIQWNGSNNQVYQPGDDYGHVQEDGRVTLTAQWQANQYTIRFDGNGQDGKNGTVEGQMADITGTVEDTGIPENGYKNTACTEDGRPKYRFSGWSFSPDRLRPDIPVDPEDQEWNKKVSIRSLAKEAGVIDQANGIIHLYATWNQAPEISGKENAYYNHIPSEEELLELVSATDREDTPGEYFDKVAGAKMSDGRTWEKKDADKLWVVDYDRNSFAGLGDIAAVSVTYRAADQDQNISEYTLMVWVLSDQALMDQNSGKNAHSYVRHIDAENYKKAAGKGGLDQDSVWRRNPEYKKVLDHVLGE